MSGSGALRRKLTRNPIPPVLNPAVISTAGVVLSLGEGNATTRFHQSNCWISRRLATRTAHIPRHAKLTAEERDELFREFQQWKERSTHE